MKRRGFLGLLAALPFAPKALAEPKTEQLTFGSYDVKISAPAIRFCNDTDTGFYRVGANNFTLAVSDAFKRNAGKIACNISERNKLLVELKRDRDL